MKTSTAGVLLIKQFEGYRLKAYQDGGGVWTVGYGLTTAAGLMEVKKGVIITQDMADDFLIKALVQYENAVTKAITRTNGPTQSQFDAMVSLCYNIGPKGFAGSSVVRNFNAGLFQEAAKSFLLWNKDNGQVIAGLKRRREREMELFLRPPHTLAPMAPRMAKAAPTSVSTPPRSLWQRLFG